MKVFRKLIFSFFALGISAFIGCRPGWDADKHRPNEIAEMFVEAVNKGDYKRAESYWRKGDALTIEANWKMSFQEFCLKEFKNDSYKLTFAGKDRNSYVYYFQGMEKERRKSFQLYIKSVEDRWRLVMAPFGDGRLDVRNEQPARQP